MNNDSHPLNVACGLWKLPRSQGVNNKVSTLYTQIDMHQTWIAEKVEPKNMG